MFIVASDLHMTELKPAYRIEENWIEVCLGKFQQIINCAKERNLQIIIAGDFLDKSQHKAELINRLLKMMAGKNITILPGNHDIPNHNLELIEKSSLWTLNSGATRILKDKCTIEIETKQVADFYPYGVELTRPENSKAKIAIIHKFAYQQKPWADCNPGGNYKRIIRSMPGYKLIIAGDNHEDFQAEFEGCKFLNCGAMLRTDKDEQDRKPAFYIIGDDNSVERVPFRIEQQVFDEQAISLIRRKDEAIERVAEQIKSDWKVNLNFKENIQKRIDQGDLDEDVITLIKEIAL